MAAAAAPRIAEVHVRRWLSFEFSTHDRRGERIITANEIGLLSSTRDIYDEFDILASLLIHSNYGGRARVSSRSGKQITRSQWLSAQFFIALASFVPAEMKNRRELIACAGRRISGAYDLSSRCQICRKTS